MSTYDDFKDKLKFLENAGTLEVFKFMNNSPQYPFFFIVESLWCCYLVKKSITAKKNSHKRHVNQIFQIILSFLVAFVMTFTSREITSNVFHKPSPLVTNKLQLPIFIAIGVLMLVSPYDVFFKLTNLLYYFLGLFQGINEMRIFLRIIEWSNKPKFPYKNTAFGIAYGIMMVEFKYIVELCMRKFIHGSKTNLTTKWQIFKNAILCSIYYLAITVGEIDKKYRNQKLPEILLGFSIGIFNSAAILSY